jgi:hypothetical protein
MLLGILESKGRIRTRTKSFKLTNYQSTDEILPYIRKKANNLHNIQPTTYFSSFGCCLFETEIPLGVETQTEKEVISTDRRSVLARKMKNFAKYTDKGN